MATHLHTQIRGAIVTALTGLATSGTRVYANRLMRLAGDFSPTLIITLDEERAEAMTIHGPTVYQRVLSLVVAAYAKESAGLDDTLDQMAKEVETALAAGVAVDGQTLDLIYAGMSFDDELGDKPVGVRRMSFDCAFTTLASAPDQLT